MLKIASSHLPKTSTGVNFMIAGYKAANHGLAAWGHMMAANEFLKTRQAKTMRFDDLRACYAKAALTMEPRPSKAGAE